MNTHAPIVADDLAVVPLDDSRCVGCSYIVFQDLDREDHVVAASQPGTLPYVRKTRGAEMAQATMAEAVKVNTTVRLDRDLKLWSFDGLI